MIHWATWGDRRHWEISFGRFRIVRWCPGAPCHLPEVAPGRHWIRLVIHRRSESARFDSQSSRL